MKTYNQFKIHLLKNKNIKEEYEALKPEFEIIALLIKKRFQKGFTQQELAKKMGTKQSAISRLESGTYNPGLTFLFKVADALDARLRISIKDK
ncbi:MAG: XRE family transcriptional regulator [Parcubacteria group bacterium Gr01-1014_33]|nr:MAG: XRE family transcriptional regulator [Parcubacteria group bacterium Gr01-1014_33]